MKSAADSAMIGIFVCAAGAANAQPAETFYAGKTIRLAIGPGVGGSIDLYARLVGRHLGKHLPGQPAIVPQDMPAGSGLALVNFAAASAPQDGTWLGAVTQALPFGGASNASRAAPNSPSRLHRACLAALAMASDL